MTHMMAINNKLKILIIQELNKIKNLLINKYHMHSIYTDICIYIVLKTPTIVTY